MLYVFWGGGGGGSERSTILREAGTKAVKFLIKEETFSLNSSVRKTKYCNSRVQFSESVDEKYCWIKQSVIFLKLTNLCNLIQEILRFSMRIKDGINEIEQHNN